MSKDAGGKKAPGVTYGKVVSKSASASVDTTTSVVLADSTDGNVTITLPAAATNSGRIVTVIKTVAGNNVVVDGNGSETINGSANVTMDDQYDMVTVVCNGTAWFVIGRIAAD